MITFYNLPDLDKFTVHKYFSDLKIGTIFKISHTIFKKLKNELEVPGNVEVMGVSKPFSVPYLVSFPNAVFDVWVEPETIQPKIIDLV